MSGIVMEKQAMRDAFGDELLALARNDARVYALDGDLANSTKIDKVASQLPEQFLQMGIAEQNMIGVAAGLASVGLQPWAATFAAFLTKRSLDQIQVVVAQPRMDVKLIGAYSGLINGCAGKTHQATEDVSIMRSLAYMTVLAPGDTTELREMMKWANAYNGPVYIRMARDPVGAIVGEGYRYEHGKGVRLKEGSDLTIVTSGTQTHRSLQAARELEAEGVSAAVLHLPSIKPLDEEAIVAAAQRTGAILTTEEHTVIGGLGSAVAEVLVEHCPVPMLRLGVQDINIQSGSNNELLERYGLSVDSVKQKAKQLLGRK